MKLRFPDVSTAEVSVVDDLMLDCYLYDDISHIYPETLVFVVNVVTSKSILAARAANLE